MDKSKAIPATNLLQHTTTSAPLSGRTGPSYSKVPAILNKIEDHLSSIFSTGSSHYPFLTFLHKVQLITQKFGFNSIHVEESLLIACKECKNTKKDVEKNPERRVDGMFNEKGLIRVWKVKAVVEGNDSVLGFKVIEGCHCCFKMEQTSASGSTNELSGKVCLFLFALTRFLLLTHNSRDF